ncbi:MAG: poly-gamma-glutamate synthase PgsB [Ignavibacteriae bacterium]|nr:poly-gamma-glutamate synthase PgsB [Ignavibacteriota bacterium]
MLTSYIVLVMLLLLAVAGVIEFSRHQKRVRSIPVRVHVNGTRGKSSVTRLIAAGLRAGGIATIAKVTGTYPRLILEDGSDVRIYRRGGANILEQLHVTRFVAERNVRALVVECMALQPQFQWISENQMIHATVGAITNVRLDHVEIMGRTLPEIAAVLGETIPPGRHFFTAETVAREMLAGIAAKKNATMCVSSEDSVSIEEMQGFNYIEHRENVALAVAVCEHLGVRKDVALQGMYAAVPDAGVLTRAEVEVDGKRITFYNAFAANDPDSTYLVWRRLHDEIGMEGKLIVMLNTRQDRLDRARQLAELAGTKLNAEMDYLMLIGQCPEVVRLMAMQNGVASEKILEVGWTTPETVFDAVKASVDGDATVVAIGNMGGMGAKVAEYFEFRSLHTHDRIGDYVGAGSEPLVV